MIDKTTIFEITRLKLLDWSERTGKSTIGNNLQSGAARDSLKRSFYSHY